MTRVSVLGLTALALSLAGAPAGAQTNSATATATATPVTDRPDAGPPLLDPNIPHQTTSGTDERPPGLPPPRALDSKRTPMPDREALPYWIQIDTPLAPPTPYVPPPPAANQIGGGAARVKKILNSPGAGEDVPRGSVTLTPEDQVPMPAPGRPGS